MNKLNFTSKKTGDTLQASEWNSVVSKVDELVDSANNSGGNSGGSTPVVIDPSGILSTSAKGNVTLGSGKNINVEPAWNSNADANYTGNEGDIALKPGDDIQFCSHHRAPKKRDKIVIKNIDGSDNPVKAQIVAGEIELAVGTTNNPKSATRKKDKNTGGDTIDPMFKASEAKVLDIKILTGNTLDSGTNDEREERGYLKVRAQAIDLRCEKHGGIALQPKGYDSEGHMNKIKFEHGGGDGLEFGTFNAEKTSIYTDEYRFKKDGVWKMATRTTEASGKNIVDERENGLQGLTATGAYKYVKNTADDFYDFFDPTDVTTTTKDLIKTAYSLNNTLGVETHITSKGNLEIETSNKTNAIKEFIETAKFTEVSKIQQDQPVPEIATQNIDFNKYYFDTVDGVGGYSHIIASESPNIKLETDSAIGLSSLSACVWDEISITADNFAEYASQMGTGLKKDTDPELKYVDGLIYGITNDERKKSDIQGGVTMVSFDANLTYVKCRQLSASGGISLESDNKIKLSAPKLTLEGVTGFGSTMSFGETDEGIRYQYKATKKGKNKQCDVIQIEVLNNGTEAITFNKGTHVASNSDKFGQAANSNIPTFCNTGAVTVPAGSTIVVAQASVYDIIQLVNYFKNGAGQASGPWAQV